MSNNHIAQATNSLLTQLVLDLKSGYLRRCESLGLDASQMQALLSLTLEDLHYLTSSQVSVMSFRIDYEMLARIQQQARLEQKRLESIDRALALGGSIELMQHYFGLSSAEVAARRRMAGITVRSGRGNVLSDEDSAQVWARWQKAGVAAVDSPDGLDAMMLTAEQLDISLTAVWHAVQGWQTAREPRGRTVRRRA